MWEKVFCGIVAGYREKKDGALKIFRGEDKKSKYWAGVEMQVQTDRQPTTVIVATARK